MHGRSLRCLTFASVSLALLAGCASHWRPDHARLVPASQPDGLADELLGLDRLCGRWVYARRTLVPEGDEQVSEYVRHVEVGRFGEGELVGDFPAAIRSYLAAPGEGDEGAEEDVRPIAPRPGKGLYFFELADPIAPVPVDAFTQALQAGTPVETSTSLIYYNEKGVRVAEGTLSRSVELEGFEDVTCPAGEFKRCARVRLDLSVQIPWIINLELTSYLWSTPEMGEVQRIQRFKGWFLFFWFHSAHEYKLIRYEASPDAPPARAPAQWTHGAVLLDGRFPHPFIAGMRVDLRRRLLLP